MIYKFRSVKITHDILHRMDFSYIAELFRFMGILVCENILIDDGIEKSPKEKEAEKNTVYSAEIFVGRREINEIEAEVLGCSGTDYQSKLDELPERTVFLYDIPYIQKQLLQQETNEALPTFHLGYEPVKEQKAVLCTLCIEILSSIYDGTAGVIINVAGLSGLIDIYVDEKLWLHSMNMQYYAIRPSEAVSEAKGAFLSAHSKVEEILEKSAGKMEVEKRLYEYAGLWCEVKINNACKYSRGILYFSVKEVAKRCRSLSLRYPDFSNAKILLGLSYEPSFSSANEALAAFDDVLKEIRAECFASAVYYWVGKRYEPYPDKKNFVKKAYELAYQRKAKFRNIFKLAIEARNSGDNEKAVEWFDEIINRLELKRKLHFLDPLELEYLFKTYVQKCNIYYREDNITEAIKAGEKAIWIKNVVGDKKRNNTENRYFEKFYREDSDRYRKMLAARFNVDVVNKMLAVCYSKVFDEEKAKEYREKVYENSSYKGVGGSWKIRVVN